MRYTTEYYYACAHRPPRTLQPPRSALGSTMGDESPAWVLQTQETLGSLIKRPKLTEALLQKPPFRFLHDIVSEVTKVTGYASGLYQEDELNSGKIKVRATVGQPPRSRLTRAPAPAHAGQGFQARLPHEDREVR